jgi:2-polyprenyl-3-methyl-5-hydroxy-6-metoxy-1,4-benzoquinol methylase
LPQPIVAPLQVPCTICGQANHVFLYRPRLSPGPIVQCRGCGLIYVSPVERIERLAGAAAQTDRGELLDAAETPEYRALYLAEASIKQRLYGEILDRIEHVTGRRGLLLDVGSYMGLFMRTAADRGWRCQGVEPDRNAWSYAVNTLALDVCWGTLETCDFAPESFDAVTMLQVLEHLSDPAQTLRHVRHLLRPGGVLIVEVPNIDCWPVRILGRRHRHFAKHHFTFFGLKTLSALLERSGYEVVSHRYPARHVSIRLLDFALRSWHPGLHRLGAPVLGMARVQAKILTLNLHEVLSVCARRVDTGRATV